jgi:hypothetical protein
MSYTFTISKTDKMSVADYDAVLLSRNRPNAQEGTDTGPTIFAELVDITQTDRRGGDSPKITLTQQLHQQRASDNEYEKYALVLRRCFDVQGISTTTRLEIQSPIVRKALHDILQDYPAVNLHANPILIPKPYLALFHFRKEIRQFASSVDRSAKEKTHLTILTDFMFLNLEEAEAEYPDDLLLPEKKVSWQYLWTIFCPEDLVVKDSQYFQECYRVVDVTEVKKDGVLGWKLTLWHWDTDGTHSGPDLRESVIFYYSGARDIALLDIRPFRFLLPDQQQTVRERCIRRGRQWEQFLRISHKEYIGKHLR